MKVPTRVRNNGVGKEQRTIRKITHLDMITSTQTYGMWSEKGTLHHIIMQGMKIMRLLEMKIFNSLKIICNRKIMILRCQKIQK